MYSIVRTHGDELPLESLLLNIIETGLTLEEASQRLKTSGDLIVYSDTLRVVTENREWTQGFDYPERMLAKQEVYDSQHGKCLLFPTPYGTFRLDLEHFPQPLFNKLLDHFGKIAVWGAADKMESSSQGLVFLSFEFFSEVVPTIKAQLLLLRSIM